MSYKGMVLSWNLNRSSCSQPQGVSVHVLKDKNMYGQAGLFVGDQRASYSLSGTLCRAANNIQSSGIGQSKFAHFPPKPKCCRTYCTDIIFVEKKVYIYIDIYIYISSSSVEWISKERVTLIP